VLAVAFLTLDEAFSLAAKACPRLTRESFKEEVREHIAVGTLRAFGFPFFMIWLGHAGDVGSLPVGHYSKSASPARVEIPPLAIADYGGPDYDGMIARGKGRWGNGNGWEDVRLLASDAKRLWPPASAAAIGPKPKPRERVKAEIWPATRGPGRVPIVQPRVECEMRGALKSGEITLDGLRDMYGKAMAARFHASRTICHDARVKVLSEIVGNSIPDN
jgi:hypothetical protein